VISYFCYAAKVLVRHIIKLTMDVVPGTIYPNINGTKLFYNRDCGFRQSRAICDVRLGGCYT
jgi:hypothetical protein